MAILKTMGSIEGSADVDLFDTIEFAGKMWIVPNWIESQDGQWLRPERIICLDQLPHQRIEHEQAQFLLNIPIPKAVYDGPDLSQVALPWIVQMKPEYVEPHPNAGTRH